MANARQEAARCRGVLGLVTLWWVARLLKSLLFESLWDLLWDWIWILVLFKQYYGAVVLVVHICLLVQPLSWVVRISSVLYFYFKLSCLDCFFSRRRCHIEGVFGLVSIYFFKDFVNLLLFLCFALCSGHVCWLVQLLILILLGLNLSGGCCISSILVVFAVVIFNMVEYLVNLLECLSFFLGLIGLFDTVDCWYSLFIFFEVVLLAVLLDFSENRVKLFVFKVPVERCSGILLLNQLLVEIVQLVENQINFKLLICVCFVLLLVLVYCNFFENSVNFRRINSTACIRIIRTHLHERVDMRQEALQIFRNWFCWFWLLLSGVTMARWTFGLGCGSWCFFWWLWSIFVGIKTWDVLIVHFLVWFCFFRFMFFIMWFFGIFIFLGGLIMFNLNNLSWVWSIMRLWQGSIWRIVAGRMRKLGCFVQVIRAIRGFLDWWGLIGWIINFFLSQLFCFIIHFCKVLFFFR